MTSGRQFLPQVRAAGSEGNAEKIKKVNALTIIKRTIAKIDRRSTKKIMSTSHEHLCG
jgi:hypothetical protein